MERVLTYGQGKQFCKLIREGIQIRINLSKNIDSQNVEAAIFSLLQEYAKTADSSEEGTNKWAFTMIAKYQMRVTCSYTHKKS